MQHEDSALWSLIRKEEYRQKSNLQLIASENYTSAAVREAQGSILTNKYAEGYPYGRYYGGCQYVDEIETIARERAKALFGARYVNVQPHSGSQANQAVMLAWLRPGDRILGMSLDAGGHLTHGARVSASGKFYEAIHYGVTPEGIVDYDQVRRLAHAHRPKLIIAGFSCYAGLIDWSIFREIADEVGACFLADMAHVAGLVAAGVYPSPLPFADVVTTTTHKTLRGPRGGMILAQDDRWARALDSAVFPGLQGGPLMHVIAAKAVCFKEAMSDSFTVYQTQVLKNAKALSHALKEEGFVLSGPMTENHMVVLDLRSRGVTGAQVQAWSDLAGISLNKNAIAHDPLPPTQSSGVRLGTAAVATRGLQEEDMQTIARALADCLAAQGDPDALERIRTELAAWLLDYPLYAGDEGREGL